MRSTPRRCKLSSQARKTTSLRRPSRAPPAGRLPTLLAMRAPRRPRSARPRISSESPYAFAVSNKVTPRSRARATMRWDSSSGVRLPKFIVPQTIPTGAPAGLGSSQSVMRACVPHRGRRGERRSPVDRGEGATRPREEEALLQVAAQALQRVALLAGLDAFRQHGDAQLLAQRGDGPHQLPLGGLAVEVAHQRDVQLGDLRVELDEAGEPRVAGAQVVNRDGEAHPLEAVDAGAHVGDAVETGPLGDLEHRPAG